MSLDYKSILKNRYILYLLFLLALLQIVVFLNMGDFQYVAILLVAGALVSRFHKNMIVVLFTALIATHLVKVVIRGSGAFSYGEREGLESSGDTTTDTTSSTVSMSAQDIKQTIQEQEDKKKEVQNEINNIYLNNKKEIANLEVVLKEAQAAQAAIPST